MAPPYRQCLRRGGNALLELRLDLQRRWRTLDERTRSAVSLALVQTEAALQQGGCAAARRNLGFARQVLQRGVVGRPGSRRRPRR